MIDRKDTLWWHKLNGLTRRLIAHGALNPIAKPIVLTEYPKSGGSWMSQMLSASLEIPYTRNRLPTLNAQILHGCFLRTHKNIDTVVVWRDGRDTMISYYYHIMFDKPITSAMAGNQIRRQLSVKDPYDLDTYLPRFVEWACTGGYPRFTWGDFVNNWHGNKRAIFTSYEACLDDPLQELKNILENISEPKAQNRDLEYVVSRHSFESQSNRKPGEESVTSFIRKGIAGDWKEKMNREAGEIFLHYCGSELKLLGYCEDDTWTEDL